MAALDSRLAARAHALVAGPNIYHPSPWSVGFVGFHHCRSSIVRFSSIAAPRRSPGTCCGRAPRGFRSAARAAFGRPSKDRSLWSRSVCRSRCRSALGGAIYLTEYSASVRSAARDESFKPVLGRRAGDHLWALSVIRFLWCTLKMRIVACSPGRITLGLGDAADRYDRRL